jgi:hypothetical protein
MLKQLIPSYSLILEGLEGALEEVNSGWVKIFGKFHRFVEDVVHKLKLTSGNPRSTTMQHLIKDKPDCPNITLRRIGFPLQQLHRHIEGRAHRCLIL